MLHLSTIRQHFDSGFSSVLSLIEDLEQQIESLTLANQSSLHIQHLEQTISVQHSAADSAPVGSARRKSAVRRANTFSPVPINFT